MKYDICPATQQKCRAFECLRLSTQTGTSTCRLERNEVSADKRVVTTDALETLGTIHTKVEKRDAIHLAVEPVTAGTLLAPGTHIVVKDGIATPTLVGEGIGIVDPFLKKTVEIGERFWFVMYPRQVHSLRHAWTHPAFPDEP